MRPGLYGVPDEEMPEADDEWFRRARLVLPAKDRSTTGMEINISIANGVVAIHIKDANGVVIPDGGSTEGEQIMASLESIRTAVARNNDVQQSAVTLLQQLSQQLRDAADDEDIEAIRAISEQLNTQADNLARAVSENTPAAPSGGGGASEPIPDEGGATGGEVGGETGGDTGGQPAPGDATGGAETQGQT